MALNRRFITPVDDTDLDPKLFEPWNFLLMPNSYFQFRFTKMFEVIKPWTSMPMSWP